MCIFQKSVAYFYRILAKFTLTKIITSVKSDNARPACNEVAHKNRNTSDVEKKLLKNKISKECFPPDLSLKIMQTTSEIFFASQLEELFRWAYLNGPACIKLNQTRRNAFVRKLFFAVVYAMDS